MTVVSPWSRGGWINSQVFDHTSVLKFLELWTGVQEPNISAWRPKITGDLMSCFDFAHHDVSIPALPDTAALRKIADETESKLPKPTPPAPGQQAMPVQEPGPVPARALPYQPLADVTVGSKSASVALSNAGPAAVQFQVYGGTGDAQRIDVGPGAWTKASVPVAGAYDIAVHGPNGFLREAAGDASSAGVEVAVSLDGHKLRVTLSNSTSGDVTARVSGLGGPTRTIAVRPGHSSVTFDPFAHDHGWYDIAVTLDKNAAYRRRFAGHVENGKASRTG
jgi:phospholipase C